MASKLLAVTGGSKGIGRAIAHEFARNGYDVATCARNTKDLQRLHDEFETLFPGRRLFWQAADLSDKGQVAGFADFVNGLGLPVSVLVNNTGVFMPGQLHTEPEGALESQIQTNLYSAYHLTRALLPPMIERREGDIFNICSIASIMAYPNGGSYTISKFALYGMTKVLREELKAHGIRVTAVLPGATLTDSWGGTSLPPDRFMAAHDVAEAIYAAHSLSRNTVLEEILLRPQLGDII